MIVYRALDLMAALLMRKPGMSGLLYWAVGSGDPSWDQQLPTEDPKTIRLVNEVYRKSLDPSRVIYHADTRQLEVNVSFAPDEAAAVLREFGLFGGDATATPNSGYLVEHRVHAAIDKRTPQILNRSVRLTLGQNHRAFDLVGGLLANDHRMTGIQYWAVGTGDPAWDQAPPAPDPSVTQLRGEIYRKPVDPGLQIHYESQTRTLEVHTSFSPDEAPAILREFGVFGGDATLTSGSGYLVNYRTHAAIDKTVPRVLDRVLRFTLGGTPSISVPALVGQAEANARAALSQAGLIEGVVVQRESPAPTGSVIAQDPQAGAVVAPGIAVNLTLATPVTVGVPDLSLLQPAAAAQVLAGLNLRLADPPAPTAESDAPAGTIVAQTPGPGQRAPTGSAVTVTLAVPRTAPVPNVVGLWVDDATAHLQAVGLKSTADPSATQERADVEPGRVVAQTPAADTQAPVGSIVQLATAVAPTVVVPNIVGLTPTVAGIQLQAVNLALGAVTQQESTLPAGTIISQVPAAGGRAPRGGTLSMVSALPVTAVVPDLTGMTLAAATAAVAAAQLALAPSPEHQLSTATPESVVDQAPQAGIHAPRGSPVKVTLATPLTVAVPQLVNIALALARELISSVSLKVNEPPVERQTNDVAAGTVLVQDPAAGTSVALGTPVTLTVAVPIHVAVPNLAGRTLADAGQALQAIGLTLDPAAPTRQSDAPSGTIIEQNPVAGTSVLLQTVVHVVVATPRLVTVPSVVGLTNADASSHLTAVGLTMAVTANVASSQPVGTVVQQMPAAGQQVQVGSAVNVSVARATVVLLGALGPEPDSLFAPVTSMLSAHHVLRAINAGPFDEQKFTYQPVIFDAPPDVQTVQVTPAVGEPIVAAGRVTTSAPSTAVVTLPQMRVMFHLRKDLRWDDGTPLTSTDSLFGFELANDAAIPASRFRVARTAVYKPLDDFTVTWWGLPGWTDASVERNFWLPLPRHTLGALTPAAILASDFARHPPSYGPFHVVEWQAADHITLERHPFYFRASEGLPHADQFVLRLLPNVDAAVNQVLQGTLDLALTGSLGLNSIPVLRQNANVVNAQLIDGNSQTYLMFGVTTAQGPSRFFANPLVRQAFALAIDRQRIVKEVLGGNGAVGDSFVPPSHPAHVAVVTQPFNPAQARQLLAQAGWTLPPPTFVPAGGLVLQGPGGPFSVTLLFADFDPTHAKIADLITSMLGQLNIRVTPKPMPANALYARGRNGPLYGRQFDMALVDWTAGIEPPGELFLSEEMSVDANGWGGRNMSGYQSPEFDSMALQALSTIEAATRQALWGRAQVIFGRDVPALALFGQLRVAATRPTFKGFALDPSQESEMWNAEQFAHG